MSEPTYRVELNHEPSDQYQWEAVLIRLSDGKTLFVSKSDISQQVAFDRVQEWLAKHNGPKQQSRNVWLTEDGDIIDRHEAGVLRDANA